MDMTLLTASTQDWVRHGDWRPTGSTDSWTTSNARGSCATRCSPAGTARASCAPCTTRQSMPSERSPDGSRLPCLEEAARSVLQAKIAVAREDDAPRLLAALKRYESDCLELSQSLEPPTSLTRSWRGLVIDCARDAVDAQLKAEVDWARRTRQRIGEYVAGE